MAKTKVVNKEPEVKMEEPVKEFVDPTDAILKQVQEFFILRHKEWEENLSKKYDAKLTELKEKIDLLSSKSQKQWWKHW